MQQLCIDFDFEEEKIDEYLKVFEVDDKYKGIPAYEWHETKTKEEKAKDRRKKLLEAERKKRAEDRLRKIKEERARRRIDQEKRKEERKALNEERRKQLAEKRTKQEEEDKANVKDTDTYKFTQGNKTLVFKKKNRDQPRT